MQSFSDLLHLLRGQGYRITPVRESLVRVFCQTSSPVSVQSLAIELDGSPHKTTLYRELQFLTDRQIIQEVDFGDQVKRYELAGQHHHHAVCVNCKKVADVAVPDLCAQEADIAKQTGFTKVKHSLEFFGLCQQCSE